VAFFRPGSPPETERSGPGPVILPMNESAARRVVLLRAFERAPPSDAWSDDDRAWATRAAAQVEGENATADAFIARRGALGVERLAERDARVPKLLASVTWPAWIVTRSS